MPQHACRQSAYQRCRPKDYEVLSAAMALQSTKPFEKFMNPLSAWPGYINCTYLQEEVPTEGPRRVHGGSRQLCTSDYLAAQAMQACLSAGHCCPYTGLILHNTFHLPE